MRLNIALLAVFLSCALASAQQAQLATNDPALEKFHPVPTPQPAGLMLKKGDRLAICGDSITEQKRYSRIMEDYLTMCVPELKISVRQYGWSGEKAPGFLARMTNDCLRFKPTIATTCYGMNDHEYRDYEERIGRTYRSNSLAILEAFKANGVRVVQGSPGCVGKVPAWHKSSNTVEDLNLNLCNLRNIGVELAQREKDGFADVFWPMLTAGVAAQRQYGADYAISGRDGIHPGWAGHTIMAYAFLKALGLNGEIGVLTVDLERRKMTASKGHKVLSAKDGNYTIESSRYPFCACLDEAQAKAGYPPCGTNDLASDNTIRSGMALVPFNSDLNRFLLVGKKAQAANYKVTWGSEAQVFSADQLAKGINLAAAFPHNPFCEQFAKVDAAVAAKQAFETTQIKKRFHSPEGKTNMVAVVTATEQERDPLVAAVSAAFVPVTHALTIAPE